MSFLQPALLYGLFALAIPIIIHLFNFRKTKRVYFSNTQFLKKVKEASTAKLKLKHYLILFSRLLFILFLVLAFAQPFLPSEKELSASQQTVVYIDNSYSMTNHVDESFSALDAAIVYTNQLIDLYPSNTEYKFLTNDFDPSFRSPKSKTELGELTTELRPGSITRTWEEIYNRIKNEKDTENSNVYWIGDFQKVLGGDNEILEFDSLMDVNLIPLQFNSANNVYIDSLYLDNPFLIGNEKLKLHVIVRNRGNAEVSDLILKVFADDIQAATASVDIGANSKEEVVFDLAFDLDGIQKGRISFEEFPVSFDNDFYFTINSGDKIKVLEINESDEVTNVERVYGNTSLFEFKSFNFSNLDYSLIPKSDIVVVNELSTIEPSLSIV
ncbi:MAG: BatA domain-containing protein, partial [Bacteroidota bacterium]